MSYAIKKDGAGWRSVNGPDDVEADEIFSDTQPAVVAGNPRRIEILAKLDEIDRKSIRALREGDAAKISAYDAAAAALRTELAGLK